MIKLPLEEAFEAADCAVDTSYARWRWGTLNTYVFPKDGKHYRFTVEVHSQEGWMVHGDIEATEVVPTTKTIIEWVPVLSEGK